jgi:hypothetical protein
MTKIRNPYTIASDFIRAGAGNNEAGPILSRVEAAQIGGYIAAALGMEKDELARKLADYYLRNKEEIDNAR